METSAQTDGQKSISKYLSVLNKLFSFHLSLAHLKLLIVSTKLSDIHVKLWIVNFSKGLVALHVNLRLKTKYFQIQVFLGIQEKRNQWNVSLSFTYYILYWLFYFFKLLCRFTSFSKVVIQSKNMKNLCHECKWWLVVQSFPILSARGPIVIFLTIFYILYYFAHGNLALRSWTKLLWHLW